MTGSGDFSIGSKVWPGTSKLLEEMGELQQVLGKLIAVAGSTEHWDGDLRNRMMGELADVSAALRMFTTENFTRDELLAIQIQSDAKLALFRKWHTENTIPKETHVRCTERSPTGNRCEKPSGHFGTCHANDGKHVEDWMNT